MQLLRLRLTVRPLMVAVAIVAWACAYRESFRRAPSPRSLLPPLTALYLGRALLDALGGALVVPRRARVVLPALAGMLLAAAWCHRRGERAREAQADHCLMATVCPSAAQGESGVMILCGEDRCRFLKLPDAVGEPGRARMLRLADHHDRMAEKYRRAAMTPWLTVAPTRRSPNDPERRGLGLFSTTRRSSPRRPRWQVSLPRKSCDHTPRFGYDW